MKLRETVVGLLVGAIAIAIFVGAIYVMAPGGSSSGGTNSPPAAQPAEPLADDEETVEGDAPG